MVTRRMEEILKIILKLFFCQTNVFCKKWSILENEWLMISMFLSCWFQGFYLFLFSCHNQIRSRHISPYSLLDIKYNSWGWRHRPAAPFGLKPGSARASLHLPAAIMTPCWGCVDVRAMLHVGATWRFVGTTSAHVRSKLGLGWPIWTGLCWPICGLCWGQVRPCWPVCGLCWGHVRPSWGYVGALLTLRKVILG